MLTQLLKQSSRSSCQILAQKCITTQKSFFSSSLDHGECIGDHENPIGFIGLGKIGFAMANNLCTSGYTLLVFDINANQSSKLKDICPTQVNIALNTKEVASNCELLITSLPNDNILKQVIIDDNLYQHMIGDERGIHMSCSTISTFTAREIAELHYSHNKTLYVSAPVFARPDGMSKAQATFPISGQSIARKKVIPILESTSTAIYDFGEDFGAANIAKLCGNFCIASAIESMSECFTLGEKNGIERNQLKKMLSETIFDCLIYKGYGQRIAEFDHTPYENAHFSLELGHKDINLVMDVANKSEVSMPFLSVLHDRYLTSMSQGMNDLDWSAIAINCAKDAGIYQGNKST